MNEQKSAVYSYQRCVFIAAVFQSPNPFQRQKISAAECHNRNGAPRFPVFRGLQTKIRDAHRASGKPAMYEHKCRYCCKLRCDHVKCQPPEHILLPEHSSHAKFRAMGSANLFGWGGPTTDRNNRQKLTSIVSRSVL